MDKKETKSFIKELTEYCGLNEKDSITIEGDEGYPFIVHVMHCFEYMIGERNCCSYVLEGIEDYRKADAIISDTPIRNKVEFTSDKEGEFTMEFRGENTRYLRYWGKLELTPDENEWEFYFELAGKRTEIARDKDRGCFVKYFHIEDGAA